MKANGKEKKERKLQGKVPAVLALIEEQLVILQDIQLYR